MVNRHAYLMMAHNDFELLTEILRDLDHEKNDIFLHIDQKSPEVPMEKLQDAVRKSRLFIVPRMSVNWAGYSQIQCELHLMQQAAAAGPHAFYHLLTGATGPIRSQEDIHAFFDAHPGKQFLGFAKGGQYLHRVHYWNLYNEVGKPRTEKDEKKIRIRDLCNGLQKRLHYVYPPAKGVDFRKGFAYWSLTEEAVQYVLSREKWIEKVFRHSVCGDEVFLHTVLWNSPFRDQIYDPDSEYGSCLRYVKPAQSWNDDFGTTVAGSSAPENGILPEDIPEILRMDRLFALKFVGSQGLEAFRLLRSSRK